MLGDFPSQPAVRFTFNTASVSSGGAPATLGGSPSLKVRRLPDGLETTAGVTLTVDAEGTGAHRVEIDGTQAPYLDGRDYEVVLDTGEVDGVTIEDVVIESFSIVNRRVAVFGAAPSAGGADTNKLLCSAQGDDLDIYVVIRRLADAFAWSTVAAAFVPFVDGNIGDYDISLTNVGGDMYEGVFPAAVAADTQVINYYYAETAPGTGTGPATDDLLLKYELRSWNGLVLTAGAIEVTNNIDNSVDNSDNSTTNNYGTPSVRVQAIENPVSVTDESNPISVESVTNEISVTDSAPSVAVRETTNTIKVEECCDGG